MELFSDNMILYSDGIIQMEYNVANDILTASLFDYKTSSKEELAYSFEKLVSTVKSYDIKNLLLDSREDVIALTDDEYFEVVSVLARELVSTRLLKIARLGSANERREELVEDVARHVLEETQTQMVFHNFYDQTSALQWLKQG